MGSQYTKSCGVCLPRNSIFFIEGKCTQSHASIQLGERLLGAFHRCLRTENGPPETLGISSLQRLQSTLSLLALSVPWRQLSLGPLFGGSLAAACASPPLSPPPAVHLDQGGGYAGQWRCLVRGSPALHRVAQVWGGRGPSSPPQSQPGSNPPVMFRNRPLSCPAGALPAASVSNSTA